MVISFGSGCLRLQISDDCNLENPEFSLAVSRAEYFNLYDENGAPVEWDEEIIKNVRALRAELEYVVACLRENRKQKEEALCGAR